ncbi:MAG: response regulator transcription factor [Ignavibacteriales bacterium]|nr:response regulator transcription factor [Ignavibacteriales bacterium]
MIKVVIADDHQLIREGIKKTLKEEGDINVVGEACNGEDLLDIVGKKEFDIVVTDLSMPGLSGLDLIKKLRDRSPKLPILVLSMHPEERFALRVLKAGASGYLTKESAPEGLVEAIRKIVNGGKYITPSLAERLAVEMDDKQEKLPHESLSDREFQIFIMLSSGVPTKDICEKLFLSLSTVHTYRTRILEKMKMESNSDLTHYAVKHGLID